MGWFVIDDQDYPWRLAYHSPRGGRFAVLFPTHLNVVGNLSGEINGRVVLGNVPVSSTLENLPPQCGIIDARIEHNGCVGHSRARLEQANECVTGKKRHNHINEYQVWPKAINFVAASWTAVMDGDCVALTFEHSFYAKRERRIIINDHDSSDIVVGHDLSLPAPK
jgi:hypothetical protein